MERATDPLRPGFASPFEDAYYRRVDYAQLTAGGGQIVQLAKEARYVVCRRDTQVTIWRLNSPPQSDTPEFASAARQDVAPTGWEKMLEMSLKTDSTIVASAISNDGKWLAISDAYETKLFRLVNEVCSIKITELLCD